jgi:signal transduction protein with GAF and PtsI domain
LIGLGVDELSAAAPAVPPIKYLIRRAKFAEARELAEFALNSESGAEIRQRSQAYARQVAPGLFGK